MLMMLTCTYIATILQLQQYYLNLWYQSSFCKIVSGGLMGPKRTSSLLTMSENTEELLYYKRCHLTMYKYSITSGGIEATPTHLKFENLVFVVISML